jgi:hypothetical protein
VTALEVRETYINVDGYDGGPVQFGESGWQPAYASTRGGVFRDVRAEFGGCISKMYRDRKITGTDAQTNPYPAMPASAKRSERWTVDEVGWVFRKRMRYEDARRDPDTGRYRASDYYTREVWVEVRDQDRASR